MVPLLDDHESDLGIVASRRTHAGACLQKKDDNCSLLLQIDKRNELKVLKGGNTGAAS